MTANPHQRTPEWFKQREGKLTASSFGQAAGLGPASRQALWRRLMGLEIFEGNDATAWGELHEPDALSAYKSVEKGEVSVAGFFAHPTMDWLGGSPDFLVDGDGMGEIKCPFNQKQYDGIPVYYMAQMQGLMQVCQRSWCDFVVWTPESMTMTRVFRSEEYWRTLLVRLADFWTWVVAQVEPPREKKIPFPDVDVIVAPTRVITFAEH